MVSRRTTLALLLLYPLLSAAGENDALLDDILARNTEALGGASNWARVENIRVLLDIAEPGFEVSGTYVATRNGDMRMDIEAGGKRVFSEGLNRGSAWQWSPGSGVSESSEAGAEALRNGIEAPGRFHTLEQVRNRGAIIELLDSADEKEWRLRVTLPSGSASEHFIDRASMLCVREESRRAFHPDVDPAEVTIVKRNFDPAWVDGVLRFMRSETRNAESGEWLGNNRVRSVEHNIAIPVEYFLPPPRHAVAGVR